MATKAEKKLRRQEREAAQTAEPEAEEMALNEGADSLEEAIGKLTPEQAEMFMRALSLTMKKRRLMLGGNLLALLLIVVGMLGAFMYYASLEPGSFGLWVFLLPFGAGGFCLWLFGKLALKAGSKSHRELVKGPEMSARTGQEQS